MNNHYYYDKINNVLLKLTDNIQKLMPNINIDDYLVINETTYNKVAKEGYIYKYNLEKNELDLEIDVELRKGYLREKREPLLIAFDKYKTNVYYGIEIETEEQHQKILVWYQDLKELEENAFVDIPERIKYYLEAKK